MKCPLLYPPRITLKDESEESVLVTIVCSVTTAECKFHQILKNYNFPFNTVVGGVTYGGIIGTGCHVKTAIAYSFGVHIFVYRVLGRVAKLILTWSKK